MEGLKRPRSRPPSLSPWGRSLVAISGNGTTLTATGTKTGPLPGETGSGGNSVATDVDFFPSTTPPTLFAF